MVGSICSAAKKRSITSRVAEPASNSTNGSPARSRGATRLRRASGCVGVVISSSSSRSTGTVTRSDSSTGSVSRPASTRPPRISCTDWLGSRDRQPDVELRVDAAQVLQQRREHVEADGHPACQPQRAAQLARPVGDRADRFADVLKDALAELDEAFGGRRHPHLAADAQEQRLAELLFEQQNLAADRRLRDVQLAAARGERSGFGDRLENFELAKVHGSVYCSRRPCEYAASSPACTSRS